jgi:phthalate 4,5-cis-dihydrodiol dehydrogenase
MIGIGIIGAGYFGEFHAKAILETPGIELIAASRRNKKELNKFSDKFNIIGYTDYRELIKNPDIDAVIIAVPHQDHTVVSMDAAVAGKHILLEKPMATSIEDCDRIIASAKKAGICLMLGHSMQYIQSSTFLKEIVESGEIGEIINGTGTLAKKWMNPNRRDWHRDDPVGGGMLITVGVHYIDLLTWLFKSKVSSVRASISTKFHEYSADDSVMLFMEYESGACATIINTGYSNGGQIYNATITGTKGMARAEVFGGVHIGKNDKWDYVPDSASEDTDHEALIRELKDFAEAVETNSAPQITGEYGKHIMEIVFAARESSKLKKEIWI